VSETHGRRYLKKKRNKGQTRDKQRAAIQAEDQRPRGEAAPSPPRRKDRRGQPRVTTSRASEKEALLPDCDQFRRRCAPCAQQCAGVRVRERCAFENLMRSRLRHPPLPPLCRISPRARVAHVRRQRDRHMHVARIHAHGCGYARPPPRWLAACGDIQMIKSIIGQWRRKPTLWISRYA